MYKKSGKVILVFIILGTIFFFIGKALYQSWSQVSLNELEFRYIFLILSFVLLMISFLGGALGWNLILKALKEKLHIRKCIRIIAICQIGRYIPGKIWATVGKVYFAKKEGISNRKAIISVVLETILLFLSSLIIFFIFTGSFIKCKFPIKSYTLLLSIFICLVVVHPSVFSKIVNFLFIRFKKEPMEFNIGYFRILQLLLLYCVLWVLYGMGFYFLIKSFYPIEISTFYSLIGICAIAWSIGFISLITPGGLGVREGILSFLLKFYFPVSIGIIAALLARIWTTVGEIILFAIFVRSIKKYVS
ncbi:flippase-like domain-containing protein [candidate division WOR-3 bacterium]|nr:flippase-like domain-containing protein [candidate division WOR-3 bacterium]